MRLVVATCDAFSFALEQFFRYWEYAWRAKQHLFTEVHVLTNTRPVRPPEGSWCTHFEAFYTGPDEGWSNNMIWYLAHIDDNSPFLLMLEDYILRDMDIRLVEECMRTIEVHDSVGMVRLVPIPGPTLDWNDHRGRHPDIGRLDRQTHESYCLSLQAAMWKPRALRQLMDFDENPWQTESRGSRRARKVRGTDYLCTREPALDYLNYLKRGAKRIEVVEWMKEHPYGLQGGL